MQKRGIQWEFVRVSPAGENDFAPISKASQYWIGSEIVSGDYLFYWGSDRDNLVMTLASVLAGAGAAHWHSPTTWMDEQAYALESMGFAIKEKVCLDFAVDIAIMRGIELDADYAEWM